MGGHPLDISNFILTKGVDLQKKYPPKEHNVKSKPFTDSVIPPKENATPISQPKIAGQYWSQLNIESRKIFSSRAWKLVDFNPMLKELQDLSKLSEKWLKWAIPTYANGLNSGPIRDWLDGKNRDNDFHYVLVGEHLRYFKEVRKQKKTEQEELNSSETITINSEEHKLLDESIIELTEHISWFQEFIDKKSQ
jgi:hypothetical protein